MKKILFLLLPLLLVSCSSGGNNSSSSSSSSSSSESTSSSETSASESVSEESSSSESTSEESSSETSSSEESSESSSEESSSSESTSEESSSQSSEESSSSITPEDISFKTGKLYEPVYDKAEDDYLPKEIGTLSYLYDSTYEYRAFLSVSSFFSLKASQSFVVTTSSDSTVFSFSGNMGDITFSSDGDITFTNQAEVGSLGAKFPMDLGSTLVEENTHTKITSYTLSTVTSITRSLSKYNLPYYFYNDDVYLPTGIFGALFLYELWSTISFNGLDFFLTNDGSTIKGGNEWGRTEFGDLYYGSGEENDSYPMKSLTTKSEADATLDANVFLFTIDTLYGFSENAEFADGYGTYLKENYLDTYNGLYSTDIDTVLDAYDHIIVTIMGDGHSMLYNTGNCGSFYRDGQHNVSSAKSPMSERNITLSNTRYRLFDIRETALGLESPSKLGDHYLEIKDETAIIRFDEFVAGHIAPNQDDSVYEANITKDLFSLFYTCYKKIEVAGGVKNVIIDLSCNLGGDSVAMIAALGFIIEDNYAPLYDYTSKSFFGAHYATDCNANGIYEEDESPANKYTHYVLTSGSSFSCGNAFPYFAKLGGVKTIGATSGGGGYAVYPILTSEGYPIRISGPISLGRASLSEPSIDGGVTPDIAIEESDYYDIDKLTAAISA